MTRQEIILKELRKYLPKAWPCSMSRFEGKYIFRFSHGEHIIGFQISDTQDDYEHGEFNHRAKLYLKGLAQEALIKASNQGIL